MSSTLRPLDQRLVAPELPELTHPEIASWRPATLEDIDTVTAVQKAMDASDHPDWTWPREDIEDELTASHIDLQHDSVIAFDHDGNAVAWGLVDLGQGRETLVQVHLGGGVVPSMRGRGIGEVLLRWQIARGQQQLAACTETLPAWVRTSVDERDPRKQRLVERLGLRTERYFTSMERDVTAANPVLAVALPDGVTLEPYSAARDEDARLARNDSFRDHWGSQPSQPELWRTFVGGALFRADLSFLAVDENGQVLGFVLCTTNPEDWELQGFTGTYIGLVGVVRAARGRGIAPALLAATLAATRDAGLERVVLDVDTANPTGALGLYERAGFVATSRSSECVLEV